MNKGRDHLMWVLLQFISGSIQKNPVSWLLWSVYMFKQCGRSWVLAGQTKDYKIGIDRFSAKDATLRFGLVYGV